MHSYASSLSTCILHFSPSLLVPVHKSRHSNCIQIAFHSDQKWQLILLCFSWRAGIFILLTQITHLSRSVVFICLSRANPRGLATLKAMTSAYVMCSLSFQRVFYFFSFHILWRKEQVNKRDTCSSVLPIPLWHSVPPPSLSHHQPFIHRAPFLNHCGSSAPWLICLSINIDSLSGERERRGEGGEWDN